MATYKALLQQADPGSRDTLWRGYDVPIIPQLIRARAQLVKPKPDYAFGLPYEPLSDIHDKLSSWSDRSIPSVNAFVTAGLPAPFFFLESKSKNGSWQAGENQLANGMIQAHDILCSLGVQDQLFVLGAVQVASEFHMYISFGTSRSDRDGKAYTHRVREPLCPGNTRDGTYVKSGPDPCRYTSSIWVCAY